MTAIETNTDTNIVPLKDSRRHYDRLNYGLAVQWRSTMLTLANWSLGGVGVVFPNCPWNFDEEITLKVQIPVGNEIFPLSLKAHVVHHDVERHYVGLKFLPLPAATYYALKYIFTQIIIFINTHVRIYIYFYYILISNTKIFVIQITMLFFSNEQRLIIYSK